MSQCKFVATYIPDPRFNEPVKYQTTDGEIYTFYRHNNGLARITNVQFCQYIGRKSDVFECLNEGEWKKCLYYRLLQSDLTPLALDADITPADGGQAVDAAQVKQGS